MTAYSTGGADASATRRPDRTLLGAALGAALGLTAVGILQQAAIVPPERLVVFGLLGLGLLVGGAVLAPTFRSGRFAAVAVLALLTLGHAVAGMGAWRAPGYLEGGCTLTALTAAGDVTPADTSASHPLVVDPDAVLSWSASTPVAFSEPRISLGLNVGGAATTLVTAIDESHQGLALWGGELDVPLRLEDVRETVGLPVRGVVHLVGTMEAPEGRCAVSVYVAVPPTSAFAGPILTALWLALVGLLAAIALLVVRGRRR